MNRQLNAPQSGNREPEPPRAPVAVTLNLGNGGRLTPEDVDLIEAVGKARSILGASRTTGVSYRKCWLTVDALNRMFESPVFATFPGRRGGGAELTAFGARLVALYRSIERRSRQAAAEAMRELSGALNPHYGNPAADVDPAEPQDPPPPRQSPPP